MMLSCLAPAKINLTLHVTGRRADGYHLLDSLVVFVDAGDVVSARPAAELSLQVSGAMARHLPVASDNLVLRAARAMGVTGAALTLDKRLPVTAGIGGGSADAAAALRLLARLTGRPLPDAAALGADVPVCLSAAPCRMRGIGEVLDPVPVLPPVWLVLVNPGAALSTPEVFARLTRRDKAPMPETLPRWPDTPALIDWLSGMRNDLEPPAITALPVIAEVLAALRATPGCALARMSGSGATCFGLFPDAAAARQAARTLSATHRGWWVRATAPVAPQAAEPVPHTD